MATTVCVTLTSCTGQGGSGLNSSPSFPDAAYIASEALTANPSPSPPTPGTIIPPTNGLFWVISINTGPDAWISFGSRQAATGVGFLVPNSGTLILAAQKGQTYSVAQA